MKKIKAAIYLRVSTKEQNTDNQKNELLQVAERARWDVTIYEDFAISGAKGRDKRPEFNRLHLDAARRKFDIVAAWSVDRLGRSLQDLTVFLSDIHSYNIDLYLHQQGIDTTTPAGKAMFQMLAVFAEFERSMISERVIAGLARAQKSGVTLGRRKTSSKIEEKIRVTLESGVGILKTARMYNVGTSVAQRIANDIKKNPGYKQTDFTVVSNKK